MSPLLLEGIQARLGQIGAEALYRAQEVGLSFRRFWESIASLVPELSMGHVNKEWKDVWQQSLLEPQFRELGPDDVIPDNLYRVRTIEQSTPYSYRVHLYGRNIATGRYASENVFLMTEETLTKQQAEDIVMDRISERGDSPKYNVFTIDVRGAFTRSAEQAAW